MLSTPHKLRTLNLPEGAKAEKQDSLMVLFRWAEYYYRKKQINVKRLGIGHPSAPVDQTICNISQQYWQSTVEKEQQNRENLNKNSVLTLEELTTKKYEDLFQTIRSLIEELHQAPNTLHRTARELAAKGCEKFYDLSHPIFEKILRIGLENIIFTQGGAGGLNSFFAVMNKFNPDGHVLTRRPYYIVYDGANKLFGANKLLTYNIIKNDSEGKSELKTFRQTITEANKNNLKIHTVIFCTPNNPTGEGISKEEWEEIIEVSKDQSFYLVFDEAYAELDFSKKPLFLEFLIQQLNAIDHTLPEERQNEIINTYLNILHRSIILRSATKGLSASGNRQAIMMVFDQQLIDALIKENSEIGFPPHAMQLAYAETLNAFSPRLFDEKLEFLVNFYERQVRYVESRITEMGINMDPSVLHGIKDKIVAMDNTIRDKKLGIDGTFYVIANFNSMIGFEITDTKTEKALQEIGLSGKVLETDEDIAYYFLVTKGIMLTPLSYFGLPAELGALRITCTGGIPLLTKVLDNIQKILDRVKNPEDAPPLTPVTPALLSTPNNTFSTQSLNLLPSENFAERMKMYWSNQQRKSQDAMRLHKMSFDIFKRLIRPHCIDAINEVLKESTDFSQSTKLTKPLSNWINLLLEKKLAILANIQEIMAYLKRNYQGILPTEFNLSDKQPTDLDPELIEILKLHIEGYLKSLKIIPRADNKFNETGSISNLTSKFSTFSLSNNHHQSNAIPALASTLEKTCISYTNNSHNTIKTEDLISTLVFEKIFYITLIDPVNQEENPFAQIFTDFYHAKKWEITSDIMNKICEKRASIDYGHVLGDEENRTMMSKTLKNWYGLTIESKEILFATINPQALLKRAFKKVTTIFPTVASFKAPIAIDKETDLILYQNIFEVFGLSIQKEQLEQQVKNITLEKQVTDIKEALTANPNLLLAIDESYVERSVDDKWIARCIDEKISLGTNSLLHHLGEFKDRIIVIRSAISIFTSRNEPISILFTFNNPKLMSRLEAASVNMQVHASRAYQQAYANALNDFVTGILTNEEYKKECLQYLYMIRKFRLISWKLYSESRKKQQILSNATAPSDPRPSSLLTSQNIRKQTELLDITKFEHFKNNSELHSRIERFINDQKNRQKLQSMTQQVGNTRQPSRKSTILYTSEQIENFRQQLLKLSEHSTINTPTAPTADQAPQQQPSRRPFSLEQFNNLCQELGMTSSHPTMNQPSASNDRHTSRRRTGYTEEELKTLKDILNNKPSQKRKIDVEGGNNDNQDTPKKQKQEPLNAASTNIVGFSPLTFSTSSAFPLPAHTPVPIRFSVPQSPHRTSSPIPEPYSSPSTPRAVSPVK